MSCPNLRHLCFHGSFDATEEAILEVRKLELVDFSCSPYFTPKVLEGMSSSCCPNLRGINRRNGILEPSTVTSLLKSFPNLRMLNLSSSTVLDRPAKHCEWVGELGLWLQYLDIITKPTANCQELMFYVYINWKASVIFDQPLSRRYVCMWPAMFTWFCL